MQPILRTTWRDAGGHSNIFPHTLSLSTMNPAPPELNHPHLSLLSKPEPQQYILELETPELFLVPQPPHTSSDLAKFFLRQSTFLWPSAYYKLGGYQGHRGEQDRLHCCLYGTYNLAKDEWVWEWVSEQMIMYLISQLWSWTSITPCLSGCLL